VTRALNLRGVCEVSEEPKFFVCVISEVYLVAYGGKPCTSASDSDNRQAVCQYVFRMSIKCKDNLRCLS